MDDPEKVQKKIRLLISRAFFFKCWIKLYTKNSLQLFENLYSASALMLGHSYTETLLLININNKRYYSDL